MSAPDLPRLIQAVEAAGSKAEMIQAVHALASAQQPGAIATLIAVLGYNNPGAAVAAVDGLVALGGQAVSAILEQLDGYNYGARAWAIRALALIGDPRALAVLADTARTDFSLSVRRAAARGVGALRWSDMPTSAIAPAQTQALETLLGVTTDPEWVVRYAAVVGLHTLGTALGPESFEARLGITQHLQRVGREDATLAVRARAQLALEALSAPSHSSADPAV